MAATKEQVQNAIKTNDKAVYKALVLLHNRQTSAEQAAKTTTDANMRGFNYIDSEFLSSLAEQVKKGWTLSSKQVACARNKLPKYWRQLIEESEIREQKKAQMEVKELVSRLEKGEAVVQEATK